MACAFKTVYHFARLRISVAIPNDPIARPAMRFIQRTARSLKRLRYLLGMRTSTLHQTSEPARIPDTRKRFSHHAFVSALIAARSARNDKTTVGFVRFRRNAVMKSECAGERSSSVGSGWGFFR